jgi:cell division protein FtsB
MTPDKKTASAFVQLSAKITKLKKANKKLKKSSRKRKHEYDSDSSDSDTS